MRQVSSRERGQASVELVILLPVLAALLLAAWQAAVAGYAWWLAASAARAGAATSKRGRQMSNQRDMCSSVADAAGRKNRPGLVRSSFLLLPLY